MAAESRLERHLDYLVKTHGGFTRKKVYQGRTGAPDRQVFMPNGAIYFVEMKAPGEKPRPNQVAELTLLDSMGFSVWVIDSMDGVNDFIRHITGKNDD